MLSLLKNKYLKGKGLLQSRMDLKNNKGFTLVEIMVVMVIIAILSGIAVATLGGITESARKKAVMAEAKSAFTAAQVAATEIFALNGYLGSGDTEGPIVVDQAAIEELLGRKLKSYITVAAESSVDMGMGTIDKFTYTDNNARITVTVGDDGGLYIGEDGYTETTDPTDP